MTVPVYSAPDTAAPPNPLLAAALEYAARGWRVFPLRPGSKEPLGRLVKHGCKDATTDPATIRRWWRAEPRANIGIATGAGLHVVDPDVKDGKAGPAWIAARPALFPPTMRVETPSGGQHWYYTVPADLRLGNVALASDVDTRGTGGYVVAPPSVLPAGVYRWVPGHSPHDRPPAAAPPDLLALLQPAPAQTVPAPPSPASDRPAPAPDLAARILHSALTSLGRRGRNDTGLWHACQLRDNGFSESEAEHYQSDYWRAAAHAGDHPYTWDDALKSLKQAYRRPAREPWHLAKRHIQTDPLALWETVDAAAGALVIAGEPTIPLAQLADPSTGELPPAEDKDALIQALTAQLHAAQARATAAEAQTAHLRDERQFSTRFFQIPSSSVPAGFVRFMYFLRLWGRAHQAETVNGWLRAPMYELGPLAGVSAQQAGIYIQQAHDLGWLTRREVPQGMQTEHIYICIDAALLGNDPTALPLPVKEPRKGMYHPRHCANCGNKKLTRTVRVTWICDSCGKEHDIDDLPTEEQAAAALANHQAAEAVELAEQRAELTTLAQRARQQESERLTAPADPALSVFHKNREVDPQYADLHVNCEVTPPDLPDLVTADTIYAHYQALAETQATQRAVHRPPPDAPPAPLDAALPPVEPYRPGALAAALQVPAARPMHTPGCGGVGLHDCPACLQADPAGPDP